MSSFSGYKTTAFKETQKFFVLDPATGSPSFVQGSDLVSYITPRLNSVIAESTRLSAENGDYDTGTLIQTSGATSPGDNLASVYLVVEGGTGDFPMLNGNDLLVIAGDDDLRAQLISNAAGEGSDLVAHTGTANTVTQTLDQNTSDIAKRTIYVGSVAELEALPSATVGQQISVSRQGVLNDVGGALYEVINTTDPANDGSLIEISGTTKARLLRNYRSVVNAAQWQSGTGSDVQSALSEIDLERTGTMVGKALAGVGTVNLDQRVYLIDTPITLPSSCIIDGNGAILAARTATRIMTGSTTSYRIKFKNIIFYGEDVEALVVDGQNLDNARFEFENCIFYTKTVTAARWALDMKSQSCRITFKDCDAFDAPNLLKADCDFLKWDGGWINGYGELAAIPFKKPADSSSFDLAVRVASFNGSVFIPETDGSAGEEGVRWFDNRCQILNFTNCHFGAENGGFPIVYQYNSESLSFNGCGIFAGTNRENNGVVSLMSGVVPGDITFDSVRGLTSSKLIHTRAYDNALTNEQTDNALVNLVQTDPSLMKRGVQVRNTPITQLTSPVFRPFIDDGGQYKTVIRSSDPGTYSVANLRRANGGIGGIYASNYFELSVHFGGSISFQPVNQIKKFGVFIYWGDGSNPAVEISTLDFQEQSSTSAVGDTLLTLAANVITNREISMNLSIASHSATGDSVEIVVDKSTSTYGSPYNENYPPPDVVLLPN